VLVIPFHGESAMSANRDSWAKILYWSDAA